MLIKMSEVIGTYLSCWNYRPVIGLFLNNNILRWHSYRLLSFYWTISWIFLAWVDKNMEEWLSRTLTLIRCNICLRFFQECSSHSYGNRWLYWHIKCSKLLCWKAEKSRTKSRSLRCGLCFPETNNIWDFVWDLWDVDSHYIQSKTT